MDHCGWVFFFSLWLERTEGRSQITNQECYNASPGAEFVSSQKGHFGYEVSCPAANGDRQRGRQSTTQPAGTPAQPPGPLELLQEAEAALS